ncbi:MAG: hypothetical protein JWQ78_1419 [Sediminibacterium sp.]|nr:hypothetical protein [Sediminibacterium sp.]
MLFDPMFPGVIFPGLDDLGKIIVGPVGQLQQLFKKALPEFGQFIFHPWGDLGVNFAVNHAVFLQGTKGNGQHSLGNAFDSQFKFVEPAFFILPEPKDGIDGPFVAKPGQYIFYRAELLLFTLARKNFSNLLANRKGLIINGTVVHND